ncbi:hypothetical protein [Micromonospora sp. NPDC049274]|uniref:hypothetical protein n=1 Tax=Micromonospora sp. NPDC049274 TaxID=3154829 RepID=UPI00342803B6
MINMSTSTAVIWKVVARLSRNILTPGEVGTSFNSTPSPGVFRKFGVPLEYAYTPLSLTPTPPFYQAIKRSLADIHHEPTGKKFPFALHLPVLGSGKLRARFRLYPPATAIATFSFDASTSVDVEQLFAFRNVEVDATLSRIARTSLALINSGDHRAQSEISIQTYPAFRILQSNLREFSSWSPRDKKQLIGLLIGNRTFDLMSDDIVARIQELNSEFNKKSTDELLLLNKQSLLLLTSDLEPQPGIGDRFERSVDLVEVALAFRTFLQHYPGSRIGVEEFSDYIYWRIRSWIRNYRAIFAESVSNRYLWEHLIREFGLTELVSMVEADNRWIGEKLEQQSKFFATLGPTWWADPDYANAFANSSRSPDAQELAFLTDRQLRSAVLADVREAGRSLTAKSYKSATVMAGAAVEAMLLDALMNRTALSQQKLLSQSLSQYIAHARAENLGLDEGVLSIVDQAMRGWRNLIHPGRQLRMNVVIDEHKAKLAVNAMHALAAELAK